MRRTAISESPSAARAKAKHASGPATSRKIIFVSTPATVRKTMRFRPCSLTIAALLGLMTCFAADPARETADVIRELAASLTAGNAQEFLRHFDRAMPGYDQLSANVTALVRQGETQSYVDVVSNEGDGETRTLTVTWELRIQREGEATASARPEAKVACKLRRQGKQWRIVSFAPPNFLSATVISPTSPVRDLC